MEKRSTILSLVPDNGKKRIQFNYLRLIIVTQLACISVLVLGYNLIIHVFLANADLGRYARLYMSEVFSWMNWLFAGITLFSVLTGAVLSLRLSHRFVGPLYRIEAALSKALAEGVFPDFNIRESDELHALAGMLKKTFSRQENPQNG